MIQTIIIAVLTSLFIRKQIEMMNDEMIEFFDKEESKQETRQGGR